MQHIPYTHTHFLCSLQEVAGANRLWGEEHFQFWHFNPSLVPSICLCHIPTLCIMSHSTVWTVHTDTAASGRRLFIYLLYISLEGILVYETKIHTQMHTHGHLLWCLSRGIMHHTLSQTHKAAASTCVCILPWRGVRSAMFWREGAALCV